MTCTRLGLFGVVAREGGGEVGAAELRGKILQLCLQSRPV